MGKGQEVFAMYHVFSLGGSVVHGHVSVVIKTPGQGLTEVEYGLTIMVAIDEDNIHRCHCPQPVDRPYQKAFTANKPFLPDNRRVLWRATGGRSAKNVGV